MIEPIKVNRIPYPFMSALMALLVLTYFYLQSRTDLQLYYALPTNLFEAPFPELVLASFVLLLLMELRYVQWQRHRQRAVLERLRSQMEELLTSKKELNAKAHVYANHADKLKLFISDKLLEYIEYDEKFLHFKSIAGEVRHNGVISYDKVSTVLEQQIDLAQEFRPDALDGLQEARDSIQYLWDLLDLSTAENIALHIANQVCEGEEWCFQSELSATDETSIPEGPIFESLIALLTALTRCFGSQPISMGEGLYRVEEQPQVTITCQNNERLLGNENHIILALENLINNAQYFAGRGEKGARRRKQARIAVELDQSDGFTSYRIYNQGPHINAENAAKLYQLGYSTRRVREQQGKGLGLYFVNEIIKGYDGLIRFENIHNRPALVSLRIALTSGEVLTEVVELLVKDGSIYCRKSNNEELLASISWSFKEDITSVEVASSTTEKMDKDTADQSKMDPHTHSIDGDKLQSGKLFDPTHLTCPRWSLELFRKRKETRLVFQPEDVSGVCFEIRLPTLRARLEGETLSMDQFAMDREVASLSTQFKAFDE